MFCSDTALMCPGGVEISGGCVRLLGNDIAFPVDHRCRWAASRVYGAGRIGRYVDAGGLNEVDESDLEWLERPGEDTDSIGVHGSSVDMLDGKRGVVHGVRKYGVL